MIRQHLHHVSDRLLYISYRLERLNLRLNRCEDNGVCHLLQDLCINKRLEHLNISSNDLTHRCLAYLSSAISENTTLTHLDLSSNPLCNEINLSSNPLGKEDLIGIDSDSPFGVLYQCILKNTSLLKLDLRHCNLPKKVEDQLVKISKQRELKLRGISVEHYENAVVNEQKALAAAAEAEAAAAAAAAGEAEVTEGVPAEGATTAEGVAAPAEGGAPPAEEEE